MVYRLRRGLGWHDKASTESLGGRRQEKLPARQNLYLPVLETFRGLGDSHFETPVYIEFDVTSKPLRSFTTAIHFDRVKASMPCELTPPPNPTPPLRSNCTANRVLENYTATWRLLMPHTECMHKEPLLAYRYSVRLYSIPDSKCVGFWIFHRPKLAQLLLQIRQ